MIKTYYEKSYLPTSCCKSGTVGQCNFLNSNGTDIKYYDRGCLDNMTDFAKDHATQIGVSGITIAFFQALGIWFAANLAAAIKRNYYGGV